VAAKKIKAMRPDIEHVVTIMCDEGEKYLIEYYIPEVRTTPLESLNLE